MRVILVFILAVLFDILEQVTVDPLNVISDEFLIVILVALMFVAVLGDVANFNKNISKN